MLQKIHQTTFFLNANLKRQLMFLQNVIQDIPFLHLADEDSVSKF